MSRAGRAGWPVPQGAAAAELGTAAPFAGPAPWLTPLANASLAFPTLPSLPGVPVSGAAVLYVGVDDPVFSAPSADQQGAPDSATASNTGIIVGVVAGVAAALALATGARRAWAACCAVPCRSRTPAVACANRAAQPRSTMQRPAA